MSWLVSAGRRETGREDSEGQDVPPVPGVSGTGGTSQEKGSTTPSTGRSLGSEEGDHIGITPLSSGASCLAVARGLVLAGGGPGSAPHAGQELFVPMFPAELGAFVPRWRALPRTRLLGFRLTPPARPECQAPEVGPAQREASAPRGPCQAPTSGQREPHADGVPTRRAVPAQRVAAQPGRSRPAPGTARASATGGHRARHVGSPAPAAGSSAHPARPGPVHSPLAGWHTAAPRGDGRKVQTGQRSCPGLLGREQTAVRAAPGGFSAV